MGRSSNMNLVSFTTRRFTRDACLTSAPRGVAELLKQNTKIRWENHGCHLGGQTDSPAPRTPWTVSAHPPTLTRKAIERWLIGKGTA